MKIQQQTSVFPHAATPRFGGVNPSVLENTLFPAADMFLGASAKTESYFAKNFLNSTTGAARRLFGTIFGPILTTLAKQDYHEIARLSVPKVADFGRIVVEPPKGALVVLLFGFTLMGRLSHAAKRAIGGDRRELRDIFFRDIPTFSIILFALDPIMKKLSMVLEKKNGIQLVQSGTFKRGGGFFNNMLKRFGVFQNTNVFTYSHLEDIYRISSKNKLAAMLSNPINHKGILKAIDKTRTNRNLSQAMVNSLYNFRNQVRNAMGNVGKSGFNKYVGQAFNSMNELNALRDQWLTKTVNGAGKAASGNFLAKWVRTYTSHVPAFNEMVLSYAKNSRVWSNVAAYGIQIAILGVGIPLFNKWYTEREFKQQQAANLPPSEPGPVPGLLMTQLGKI